MAELSPSLSVITLNVDRLNGNDQQNGLKKTNIHDLTIFYILKVKGWKIYSMQIVTKRVTILMSNKMETKSKFSMKGHTILINRSIYQEDISIITR